MDDTTRNLLQGLLDMNKRHTQDIAGLQALNVIYHHVILDLLSNTNVLENLHPEVKDALVESIAIGSQMAEHARERETFDTLVGMVQQKIDY